MSKALSPADMRKKAIIENGKRKAEKIAKLKREEHLQRQRESAAKRKREERSRYSEKGLVSVTVHIKQSQKERLLQIVEGLNKNGE